MLTLMPSLRSKNVVGSTKRTKWTKRTKPVFLPPRDPTKTPSSQKEVVIAFQAFCVSRASQIPTKIWFPRRFGTGSEGVPRANMGCKLKRTCQWDPSIQAAFWICCHVLIYPASMQLWRWMCPGSSSKERGRWGIFGSTYDGSQSGCLGGSKPTGRPRLDRFRCQA